MGLGTGTVLVTGGLGCIGAWTVRSLLSTDAGVVVLDPARDRRRLRLVVPPDLLERVRVVAGDISDLPTVEKVIADHGVEHIIHLAGLQLPSCRADPLEGARVNVVGTVSVFEAARRADIDRVIYTSSIAIFDQHGSRIDAGAVARPRSHYGVYKAANEGTARAYWSDFGIASTGVRPMTVYGAGRDRGLTSSPTRAMVAAILGCAYQIRFGGTTVFQYAADVGRALTAALRAPVADARVVNLNGVRASVTDVVAAIRTVVGSIGDAIEVESVMLPFPDEIDTTGLEAIGPPEVTPLEDGVAATMALFRDLTERDALVPEEHGLVIADGVAIDIEAASGSR